MRKNKKKLEIIIFHSSNINFKTFNDVSKNSSSHASLVFLISSILDEPTKHHVFDILFYNKPGKSRQIEAKYYDFQFL